MTLPRTAEMMAELRDAGLVRPSPQGWMLTKSAEREFGDALRRLGTILDVGGIPALRLEPISGLDEAA